MTETTQDLLARLTGFTPGRWRLDAFNDECVCGKVEAVILGGGFDIAVLPGAYLKADADAQLIAAAPELHRIATEQAAEIARLREALTEIADCVDISDADAVAHAALQAKGLVTVAAADARIEAAVRAALEVAADTLKSEYRITSTQLGDSTVFGCDVGSPAACYTTIRAIAADHAAVAAIVKGAGHPHPNGQSTG